VQKGREILSYLSEVATNQPNSEAGPAIEGTLTYTKIAAFADKEGIAFLKDGSFSTAGH
jgi:hypothetical protein